MEKMGFQENWRKWIFESLQAARVTVLVNGSPTKEFGVGRCLRQGDSLSPFLFLIAAEGLNVLMAKSVQLNHFEGFQFGSDGVSVSHLQYADDTLIMGKKKWKNIWAIKATLQLFELASGLKINFHKSQLFGINVQQTWLEEAALVLNCRVGSLPFSYLGLPIGSNPRRLGMWRPVVDTVRQKLFKWNNKHLSIDGRVVLLKSVLYALPVYFHSFFKAPSGGKATKI
ncbi:uncharacterized protein LOC131603066 [Vicia villosa]|uniref:uncharacterized protein LOC131603066 n=1 Tax=Vicia villosa TaxID=3911 RepID=UPI00273CBA87|nr:uncharacterized protein LOC131603066 [Vicia villosa]